MDIQLQEQNNKPEQMSNYDSRPQRFMRSIQLIPILKKCIQDILRQYSQTNYHRKAQVQDLIYEDSKYVNKSHWIIEQKNRKYGWFRPQLRCRKRKKIQLFQNQQIIKQCKLRNPTQETKLKVKQGFNESMASQVFDIKQTDNFDELLKRGKVQLTDLKMVLKNTGYQFLAYQSQFNNQISKKTQDYNQYQQVLTNFYVQQNKNIEQIREGGVDVFTIDQLQQKLREADHQTKHTNKRQSQSDSSINEDYQIDQQQL